MTSYDVLNRLRSEEVSFDLGKGCLFCPGEAGDGWLQYAPEYMHVAFGGTLHYEICRHYSGLRVALHDERGPRDELWWKLREIAERHCLFKVRWQSQIVFERVVPRHESGDNERDFKFVQAELLSIFRELDAVLGPLLKQAIPVWTADVEAGRLLVEKFSPDDVYTAADFMRRLVRDRPPLDLGNGTIMRAHPSLGSSEGASGWKIFESFLDKDSVHFEVLVRGSQLSAELHDERVVTEDKLSRALARQALKKGFVIEDGSVVNPRRIECLRDFGAIMKDVGSRMGELWNVYGGLLKQVGERGVDSIGRMVMKTMEPIPAAHTDENALLRKDIPEDTLCWVSTIQGLFSKEVIELSGPLGVRMIPGSYIIPSYQRKYTWTAQNVNLLCRDLLRAANESKRSYHLGTIILHSSKDDNGGNEFFVVDGQQRLRTISRLLSQNIFTEEANLAMEKQFTDKDETMIWSTFKSFGEDCEKILRMLRASTVVCIVINDISESFQLFSTQNGRGKPLSPENLLKAFHFHEMNRSIPSNRTPKEFDVEWEDENRQLAGPGGIDGKLLRQVIGEHLYRIRCWLRGRFPEVAFSSKDINAFKGLTVRQDSKIHERAPLQNLSLLRRKGDVNDPDLAGRDGLAPYEFIDQPIVNGADFFSYVKTYIRAYKNLFGEEQDRVVALSLFYGFYKNFCLCYPRAGRRGDTYARHVFQSLCLYCYDRFGAHGLNECMKELYCSAYYERAVNTRCYYQSCGRSYTVKAIQCMADCSTVADVKDRLSELRFDILNSFDTEDDPGVDGLDVVRSVFSREEF